MHKAGNSALPNSTPQISCLSCPASELCLGHHLTIPDLSKLEQTVKQQRYLKRGESLYKQGDKFYNFYVIQQGTFKSHNATFHGNESVYGFHFTGEILGLDGIKANQHHYCVTALNTCIVCVIPFAKLLNIAHEIPLLQRRLFYLISQKIITDLSVPRNSGAEERLAAFLLNLASRQYNTNNIDTSTLQLSMSRQDIGNYLGLALETVSRLFTVFQKKNLIFVQGKQIQIQNIVELEKIARH